MNDLTYVQKKFINYIETIMQSNKLSHSYLIELGDSSLEFPFVLSFVKMIVCPKNVTKVDSLDCGQCSTCRFIDENSFLDLKIIEADGAQIKKNQLLSLKDEYQNTSLIGKRRVYIIKDAEKLNPSSANTILKFLEEPEEGIVAILLTKNRYQVLETILSRCQVLSLLDTTDIGIVDDNILLFIQYLLHPSDLFIHYKEIIETILIDKECAKKVFNLVEKIFIYYLSYPDGRDDLSFLNGIEKKKFLDYITIIEEELPKLVYNINYKLWLDSIYSRFMEVK